MSGEKYGITSIIINNGSYLLTNCMSSNISITKICLFCNERFVAKTTVTKFCGHKCASRSYKKRKRDEKLQKVESVLPPQASEKLIKQKEFWSIKEACFYLGIGRTTLYRAIKRKQIKSLNIGRRVIIHRDQIHELFK